ncbi:MAG: replication protein [Clostridia bacterium]|jgi:phage replication O-like protein O|nr:replication protein [Clostridia bacterium]
MIQKPNFTQTPNILFDEYMKDLSDSELRVFLAIIRKTFGWNKDRDRISLTQIQKMTGLSRQGVLNGLYGKDKNEGLIAKKLVIVYETKAGNEYEVNVVDQTENETSQPGRPEVVNNVDQQDGLASQRSRHTKETININKLSKETYAKIETAYTTAFSEIYPNGKCIINYGAERRRLNTLLSTLSEGDIINAINKAKSDKWIAQDMGFGIMTILSDNQIQKLLNGTDSKQYSKQMYGDSSQEAQLAQYADKF